MIILSSELEISHKHEGRLNDEPKESQDHAMAPVKNDTISVNEIEVEDVPNVQSNLKYPLIHRHGKDHTVFSENGNLN